MFERYTEQARRVIFFAHYEACQFGSPCIEAEHFLLGIAREDQALAKRFLGSDAALASIRSQIAGHAQPREKTSTSMDLPLSQACRRVLAYGCAEAERLGHKHIGTGHLLMGILKEEKCLAAVLLRERGLALSEVRAALMDQATKEETPASAASAPRAANAIPFERFTECAMRAALFAYGEASELGSPTVGIEHLLLGVLREDRLEATHLFRSEGGLDSIRREIEEHTPPDEVISPDADLVLCCEYRRVLRFAFEESEKLGHQKVQTGHLLLGILNEAGSLAAEILRERGVSVSTVRAELAGS